MRESHRRASRWHTSRRMHESQAADLADRGKAAVLGALDSPLELGVRPYARYVEGNIGRLLRQRRREMGAKAACLELLLRAEWAVPRRRLISGVRGLRLSANVAARSRFAGPV